MARFGRTAAVHVVEHVEERLAAPREVGVEAQVAGRQLRPGMEREMALDFLSQLGSSAGMHAPGAGSPGPRYSSPMGGAAGSIGLAAGMGGPAGGGMGLAAGPMNGMAGPDGGLFDRGLSSMGLGVANLLTGSSFALTRETRQGGILSFWSRGARSSFAGREEALSLGGDVRTMMFGADYAKGPLVTGLSLSNSRGLGEYAGVTAGQVASAVTGLYPWLGYKLSDRVSVWGVTGYGKGALTLTAGEAAALTSGLSMAKIVQVKTLTPSPRPGNQRQHRMQHGIRYTEELAQSRPRPHVPNDRLRHMLIGYARVSKADGSQSLDLQRDALQAAGVDAVHVYHDYASGVRDDRPGLDSCVRAL